MICDFPSPCLDVDMGFDCWGSTLFVRLEEQSRNNQTEGGTAHHFQYRNVGIAGCNWVFLEESCVPGGPPSKHSGGPS